MSLLEPLADALGLSLGELIRGERLPPAQQPSPEAEQDVRAAAICLGGHLRQALRRTRRLLIALSFRRCILAIRRDGSLTKSCTQFQGKNSNYVVDNTDNTAFTLHRQYRDLLYFLHES